MSDPLAGLLEGLLEGGEKGYGFRQDRTARRRRAKLDDELATLRQLEARRAETRATREDLEYEQGQADRAQTLRFRAEVAAELRRPKRFRTLGQFISGKPGERDREAPPLSDDALTAQAVGRTLGRRGGKPVSDDEALLYGSGMAPAPTGPTFTQEDYLERIRAGAGARATAGIKPMTRQQAAAVVAKLDNDYSEWGPAGIERHYLTPAQREGLIQKMMTGTITEDDLPELPSDAPAPGQRPPARKGRSLGEMIRGLFGGGAKPDPPADPAASRARVEQGRLLRQEYRELPPEEFEQALRDSGYTDEEIAEIIGTPTE